ncbi:MAG: hypothetical protein J7L96_10270 [Bacteroidales bacterium]|nr:hypothetical protein [Bacteroidales bacterium]
MMDNLTDAEQLQLWDELFYYSTDKLPYDKVLNIYTIARKSDEIKKEVKLAGTKSKQGELKEDETE